ncbi:hypothetical protein NC652_013911 [Populus alba x Populus x berolinensis]|uniref:Uncharacterized protein n=1 Tax=Populus alba x Populus x berolinensis TaxID=444605 RepID=A0AAD6QWH1_9ROSI|nr:hypothetical protein NC652_013911 [Populus alba x Populus x berolinensis]KAJ6997417.1 hypothetical protein NC653_013860 [Populus alba x Populus x berolinensis]KAJ6997438.1 hypothetical protein NC653_013876 [Populus alba x Populus x berolinensis]
MVGQWTMTKPSRSRSTAANRESNQSSARRYGPITTRSNPATNDWPPSTEDNRVFVSSKANRSES